MLKILKYLFLLVFCSVSYAAQDSLPGRKPTAKFDTSSPLSPIVFDEKKIEQYKGDKAFNYLTEIESDSWWTRFKTWLGLKYQQLIDWLFGEYEANSIISF
ncbi:MAG TPA: hypothetical protein VLN72_09220, partial [Gillisia sp.]|nr:hypothetical protein [Gillisia sp.]